jgi:hypothetical protein
MSPSVRELFRQAAELDEHDRAVLAGLLLESLEHAVDEHVESAWQDEIAQRITELDAERIERVSWEAPGLLEESVSHAHALFAQAQEMILLTKVSPQVHAVAVA